MCVILSLINLQYRADILQWVKIILSAAVLETHKMEQRQVFVFVFSFLTICYTLLVENELQIKDLLKVYLCFTGCLLEESPKHNKHAHVDKTLYHKELSHYKTL